MVTANPGPFEPADLATRPELVMPDVDGDRADAFLDETAEAYRAARPVSAGQAEAASRVLPAGSTRSVLDFGPFPFRVARADGAYLTDVDGHRYLDLLGDYSAGLLGHSPEPVREAVAAALDRGWSLGALADSEHRLAELVTERFPSMDQVRFTNSGTEANLMAISLARHHTGRDKVLVFDIAYHGGLLYFGPGGEPIQAPYDFVRCRYNDLESVAEALEVHGSEVACVLVEPMLGAGGCIRTVPGFLEGVRRLCDDHGVLLIFDEVMTSRMSIGGGQLRLGIEPDMTTLGKYLGGGVTFGAFGGSSDLMAAFDPARGGGLSHGGTFNNNVFTMSAGVAALEQVLTADALDGLFELGEWLNGEINRALAPYGFGASGWGSLMTIRPAAGPVTSPDELAGIDGRLTQLMFHLLLRRGYYIAPRGYIALSLPVTEAELRDFVAAVGDAGQELVAAGVIARRE